jgi:hypothetical protein
VRSRNCRAGAIQTEGDIAHPAAATVLQLFWHLPATHFSGAPVSMHVNTARTHYMGGSIDVGINMKAWDQASKSATATSRGSYSHGLQVSVTQLVQGHRAWCPNLPDRLVTSAPAAKHHPQLDVSPRKRVSGGRPSC